MDDTNYEVRHETPSVEDFLRLRRIAGLSPFSPEAAEAGLNGSLFAVLILSGGVPVGMGRLIGDGGCACHVVDVAVDPAHQGKGLGKRIMAEIMTHIDQNVPKTAYISMIADIPADQLYAQYGFAPTAPGSIGMYYRVR